MLLLLMMMLLVLLVLFVLLVLLSVASPIISYLVLVWGMLVRVYVRVDNKL